MQYHRAADPARAKRVALAADVVERRHLQQARLARHLRGNDIGARRFAHLSLSPRDALGVSGSAAGVPEIDVIVLARYDRRTLRRTERSDGLKIHRPVGRLADAHVVLHFAQLRAQLADHRCVLSLEDQNLGARIPQHEQYFGRRQTIIHWSEDETRHFGSRIEFVVFQAIHCQNRHPVLPTHAEFVQIPPPIVWRGRTSRDDSAGGYRRCTLRDAGNCVRCARVSRQPCA